jgi:HK97 gp10 family phage protein
MASDVQISGLSELNDMLARLPVDIEKKLMRGALRAGQKVIAEQARAQAPIAHASAANASHYGSHAGSLRDSIKVITRIKGGKIISTVRAGSKSAFYAHMVEFGTSAHWIRPAGSKSLFFAGLNREAIHHPGAKKHPFMRPAYDANAQEGSAAFQAVQAYLTGKITKELAKLPDETDDPA